MGTNSRHATAVLTPNSAACPSTVAIGGARIGPKQRVYTIAEAGVNHNGNLDAALRLVDAALSAGADAVKFQAFRAVDLVTADAATAGYQRSATGSTSQRDMLRRLELSHDGFAALQRRCRASGIEFLCTPFSVGDLRMLLDLGVRAIKIASTDLNNTLLLNEAAGAKVPLILSTGASEGDEVERTVRRLTDWGCGDRLVLLHCVSSYPTLWQDANLRRIGTLRDRFDVPVGFSDHTPSVETGALAVAAGAYVLEKHLTLDRSLPGPDQALSLEPDGLAAYIASVRHAEEALGDGELEMREVERDVRRIARKSVVAAVDIPPGHVIGPDCLTVKRPAGGIEPDDLERLIGRRATALIPADTRLTWEMVE